MRIIQEARCLIANDPQRQEAKVLSSLIEAFESGHDFRIRDLYTLDEDHFEMALIILNDWRLDRFYSRKAKIHF